jgi:hypothetical protein
MRFLPVLVMLVACNTTAYAALGDNAPAIPSTWVTSHPRLPFPTQAWLESLHDNLPARYANAADNYTNEVGQYHIQLRYAMLAYHAAKVSGENMAIEPYATWLTTITGAADKLGFVSRTVLLSDNAASGDGTGTLTTTTANLLTGCSGGSCAGNFVTANGRWYQILSVESSTSATLVTIGARWANVGYPSGSVKIRIAADYPSRLDFVAYIQAMIYDWMYADLTPTQRTDIANSLDGLCSMMEVDYTNELASSGGYSPYNDLFYGPGSNSYYGLGLYPAAVAIYPDMGATGVAHLRKSADLLFNVVLPAWKHLDGAATEGWGEYWNLGQKRWIVGATLPWANASGRGADFFTTDHPYLKTSAYWWIYALQPDLRFIKLGDTIGFPGPEHTLCNGSADIGMFGALAELYNDPVLRRFNRQFNKECGVSNNSPDGYEPSAWPYYEPDTTAKTVTEISTLPLQRNFPGVGVVFVRTGWGESDTHCYAKYGDWFWTGKVHLDIGHFSCYSRGVLALDSGTYHAGSNGKHRVAYSSQTIAHNTMTFTDPADSHASQKFQKIEYEDAGTETRTCMTMPNDGGQRRVSAVQNYGANTDCTGGGQNAAIIAPVDYWHWLRSREWWKAGNLLAYAPGDEYTYVAIDMTRAYQRDSSSGGNAFDRTRRLQKGIRQFVFIPRGTAMYVATYDQAVTVDEDFTKRWMLHSINEPSIASNAFTILRTENANTKPSADLWPFGWMAGYLTNDNNSCTLGFCYQYDGELRGWSFVNGSARTPTKVGGSGSEFDDGAGTNQNECQNDVYCGSGSYDGGLGSTLGFINPEADAAPLEPGAWRLELTPSSAAQTDHFLVLMYATYNGDTITQASVTPTTTSTHYGVTWTDNSGGCSYAITLPKSGVGGTVSATGAGCAATF